MPTPTPTPAPEPTPPVISVRGLVKHFPIRSGLLRRTTGAVRAVDGVSFDVGAGETLGLVGESGSGKSTLARAVLRLTDVTDGSVLLEGEEVTTLHGGALRSVRARMQMVFQDPLASLNPRMTIGAVLREALDVNDVGAAAGRPARVRELLELVGLDPALLNRYPHQLSGGQRQRVGIARALAPEPRFVVCDEAIAALDVSIQAQIVNLLAQLRDDLGLSYLFISHDLSMVRHLADRVAVLYLGQVVELGPAEELCERPGHPYTAALLSAVPSPDPELEASRARLVLRGDVPSPADPPPGCRFHTRCPFATDRCRVEEPALRELDGSARLVACHHADAERPWQRLDAPRPERHPQ
ncbi:oligopeptide/dipeptide ABC transporter ATP-binding protein [Conexibacter stalactiti]|uniref:ATP-binding cassette domain-containing protein n=1 Tax=Conexibacter stalactiti TaxID=1940611 RepID=A0ABU4HUP3_9ACTN|nr:oligopeptide/dipeptide ABC transporter ATP-binding protein [Conexibacter stalactiti]MDW5596996.1 ATP-binding cassette domain-containing protein [Conexibacter stalactiti]MEC5037638.1 oligopeptide/dipeptide ABC transporter ATP-binding protein [Conexibacter stalactiti]